jgi:hypothetical protein
MRCLWQSAIAGNVYSEKPHLRHLQAEFNPAEPKPFKFQEVCDSFCQPFANG